MQQSVDTAERRLTVDEFLSEYADRPGKFELVDGRVVRVFDPLVAGEEGELVNERALHAAVKLHVAMELHRAFRAAAAPLFLFGDGMSVLTPHGRVRGPDAVAIPRASFDPEKRLLTDPVFLCEVLSPTTERVDLVVKVREYFGIPTVRCYLIVDPDDRLCTLHTRAGGAGTVVSTEVTEGPLSLTGLADGCAAVAVNISQFWLH